CELVSPCRLCAEIACRDLRDDGRSVGHDDPGEVVAGEVALVVLRGIADLRRHYVRRGVAGAPDQGAWRGPAILILVDICIVVLLPRRPQEPVTARSNVVAHRDLPDVRAGLPEFRRDFWFGQRRVVGPTLV